MRRGDIDAMRELLADAGAEFVEDDSIPIDRCYATDPFGNRIELIAKRDRGFSARKEGGQPVRRELPPSSS